MSDKKNIDRLFQEKFKDFEANPPEFVWENIREVLEEKKKKRVIPLWLRLSGVAAVIIIGMLLGNLFLNEWNNAPQAPAVTTSPGATQKQQPLKTLPTDVNDEGKIIDRRDNSARSLNNGAVVNGDVVGKNTGNDNKEATLNIPPGKTSIIRTRSGVSGKEDALVNRNPNKVNNEGNVPRAKYDPSQQENAVVNNTVNANAKSKGNNIKNKTNTNALQPNGAVANNSTTNKANVKSGNGVDLNNNTQNKDRQNSVYQATTAVVNNTSAANKNSAAPVKDRNRNTLQNGTVDVKETDNEIAVSQEKAVELNNDNAATVIDKNISLKDKAIAETAVDTAAVVPENELEKLLKEQQKGNDNEEKAFADNSSKSRWNVKPQLAPVFYNSLSKGSPIDGQFASNNKSYDNDLSIGLGINYAVTNRITVRSGVNTVNLNYATQGVEFYASLNEQTNNIAARSSNANIVVQDQGTSNNPQVFFADMLPKETFNGAMVQKTGYIEVPVEMSYALLNRKFGIDIIGGVSTLFLNQNNVSVVSTQGYSTNVGKAQNLNNIHFSTNLGVGFKYRFLKSFEANFEPMFKYQVNTFSRDSGNFKPYFIGLYSGISFSF